MEVRIEQLSKHYQQLAALDEVSLTIASGELIALLGPSGSGKTTLLRLIAGLEIPDQGRIYFGSEEASALTVQERNIGFVFQHYALFRHLTVLDNIAFGLRVRPRRRRPPAAEIRRRAEELLQLVQLDGYGGRFPAQLSGGQRQRVALARALAIEPRVLLLDEPFGALDARVRKDLRRWLRELHDRTGHTTVFVTHDQEEALELADRVVVMNNGRIEQCGVPDEIYDRPDSPFVYRFIGESGCLPVEIRDGAVWLDGERLPFPAPENSGPGHLYFRLHDCRLVEKDVPAIRGRLTALRRQAGVRRAEVVIAGAQRKLDIELPLEAIVRTDQPLAFVPEYWKIFPRQAEEGRT